MDTNQISLAERGNRMLTLGGVVGIEIARRTGDFDPLPTNQRCESAQQIDGRDHCASHAELIGSEGLYRRLWNIQNSAEDMPS